MNTSSDREYWSPDYKLIACFRKSRDGWKQKAQRAQRQVRKLKERLKHVRTRRDQWKAVAQGARADVLGTAKNPAPRTSACPR